MSLALSSCIVAAASFWLLWVAVGQVAIWVGAVRHFWRAVTALSVGVGLWSTLYLSLLALPWPTPFTLSAPHHALLLLITTIAAAAVTYPPVGRRSILVRTLFQGTLLVTVLAVSLDSLRMPAKAQPDLALTIPLALLFALVAIRGFRRSTPLYQKPPWTKSVGVPVLLGLAYAAFIQVGFRTAVITTPAGAQAPAHTLDVAIAAGPVLIGTLIIITLTGLMVFADERNRAYSIAVAERSPDGLITLALDGSLLYMNPLALALVGRPLDELVGQDTWQLLPPPLVEAIRPIVEQQVAAPGQGTRELYDPETSRWFEVTVHPWPDFVSITLRDVTSRRQLEQEIRHQALHDPLTGLANRALFRDRVDQALDPSHPCNGEIAVLFLDLDDFKQVNDTWGHPVGDALLIAIGRRLSDCVRAGDTVARFGGDEFAILLNHQGACYAEVVAQRIIAAMERPFQVEGHELCVHASIGVAMAKATDDPDDLLRHVDAALYRAKANGKGRFSLFEEQLVNR